MPEVRVRRSSEEIESAILAATLELVGERGYSGVNVDSVAERAGAARSVLYRRWPDKAHLVAAALADAKGGLVPEHASGDLRADLRTVLHNVVELLQGPVGPACIALYSERSANPEVRAAAERTGLASRRRATAQVLERAVADGELDPGVLASPVPHAGAAMLVLHHIDGETPVDFALADAIIDDVVWPAVERWRIR